jgi:hypothetical protein
LRCAQDFSSRNIREQHAFAIVVSGDSNEILIALSIAAGKHGQGKTFLRELPEAVWQG